MLPRANGVMWMEGGGDEVTASWGRNKSAGDGTGFLENKNEMGSFSTFKSMLAPEDGEWYLTGGSVQSHHEVTFPSNFADSDGNMLLQPVDSSSSCSPSSASLFTGVDPSQLQYFLPPKPAVTSVLADISGNELESGFDLCSESGLLEAQALSDLKRGGGVLGGFTDLGSQLQMFSPNLCSDPHFSTIQLLQLTDNSSTAAAGFSPVASQGFEHVSGSSFLLNRSKLLKPLESFASIGAQPTLFQKRAAKNLASNGSNLGILSNESCGITNNAEENNGKSLKRKNSGRDDVGDGSIDGSGLNYDSDEFMESIKDEESSRNGGNSSNGNSTVTVGDQKEKKKGLPAKNLMAERRRRKKLNDRLYMLRSVVPRISKMDRASILGDAIEYLKELIQKINDLHNELESNPVGASLTPTAASFYPLTPTPPSLPNCIKEEVYPSSMRSPNGQPARVEVRLREGKAVNVHMFCGRKPGILLSTMRALDNLGLDIQQAVISCFNGFTLDIFRAEQCGEGQEVHPDQIKAVLLDSAGFLA